MTKSVDDFPDMSQQHHDRLCWAAVALGVDQWRHPASAWTLCQIVVETPVGAGQPSTAGCCTSNNLGTSACNHDGVLVNALRLHHLEARGFKGRPQTIPNPMTAAQMNNEWTDIKTEIDGGRVLCAEIQWSGGGFHYVVIWGYKENGSARTVLFKDPLYENSSQPYEQFVSNYNSLGGRWAEVDHVA
jgi:hypothetical protein